jgi:hypothetical protein
MIFERLADYARLFRFPHRAYLTGGTSTLLDIPRFLMFAGRGSRNIELYHALVRNILGGGSPTAVGEWGCMRFCGLSKLDRVMK